MVSFNFKLLHDLLPVRARLHHINPTTPPVCMLCTEIEESPETPEHALIICSYNGGAGQALMTTLQRILPDLTVNQLLLLQFLELSENQEMAVVFLTTATLLEIWSRRQKKLRINIYEIRTTLEAKCSLLRETRFLQLHQSLQELMN